MHDRHELISAKTSVTGEATNYIPALSWHLPSVAAFDRTDNNLVVVWAKNAVSVFISAVSVETAATSRSLLLFEFAGLFV